MAALAGTASAADVTKPVVASLSYTPASVDITNSSAQVTVTARFTDEGGVARAYIYSGYSRVEQLSR